MDNLIMSNFLGTDDIAPWPVRFARTLRGWFRIEGTWAVETFSE
jgi:hypothetical protein